MDRLERLVRVRVVEPFVSDVSEIPEPRVGPGDVLIKMRALGLCGTDLKTFIGQNPLVDYPRIPGHEIAGWPKVAHNCLLHAVPATSA